MTVNTASRGSGARYAGLDIGKDWLELAGAGAHSGATSRFPNRPVGMSTLLAALQQASPRAMPISLPLSSTCRGRRLASSVPSGPSGPAVHGNWCPAERGGRPVRGETRGQIGMQFPWHLRSNPVVMEHDPL